jgi:hypothetical protein
MNEPLHVWQRQHSQTIVAEVTPVVGIGSWEVSVWQEPDATRSRTNNYRYYSFLIDAYIGADTLAAVTFGHRCDHTCGVWQPVDRPVP